MERYLSEYHVAVGCPGGADPRRSALKFFGGRGGNAGRSNSCVWS